MTTNDTPSSQTAPQIEASNSKAGRCAVATGSRACPFCGDTRRPSIEEVEMKYDPPNMWQAVCMCCGAVAPVATTRGAALLMWDERRQPGDTKEFCKLADRLAGFENTKSRQRRDLD